jgi:hypothetical protein
MNEHPEKYFFVIGPFEHVDDKLKLKDAIQKAVMEHNKEKIRARLSLQEGC